LFLFLTHLSSAKRRRLRRHQQRNTESLLAEENRKLRRIETGGTGFRKRRPERNRSGDRHGLGDGPEVAPVWRNLSDLSLGSGNERIRWADRN